VKTARMAEATLALEALAIHRATPEIRDAVEAALTDGRAELQQQFRKLFS